MSKTLDAGRWHSVYQWTAAVVMGMIPWRLESPLATQNASNLPRLLTVATTWLFIAHQSSSKQGSQLSQSKLAEYHSDLSIIELHQAVNVKVCPQGSEAKQQRLESCTKLINVDVMPRSSHLHHAGPVKTCQSQQRATQTDQRRMI